MNVTCKGLWNAPLHVVDELPSTNTWLLDQGHGCEHGETVLARCQTAGRGRSGRTWCSAPGAGLTFSVALRRSRCSLEPEYQGAVAALALARYLERQAFVPHLKWPNDVWVDDLKIAGILSESRSDSPDLIVVGMGLNVNQTAGDFAECGLASTAVSMAMRKGHPFQVDIVFMDVLRSWQSLADEIRRQGLPVLTGGWRDRDALRGRPLIADVGGRPLRGLALGVDAQLGLLVRDKQGVMHTLRSGEVVHIGHERNA